MSNSVVMVDWSRKNDVTHKDRDQFIWHQMILALLYDDVLAQDETFVCSKQFPIWFSNPEEMTLLEELLDCGGLTVLKRPREKYQDYLRERVDHYPITTRAEHLERDSVNNQGKPIKFTKAQRKFHIELECRLGGRSSAHRYAGAAAGAKKNPNLMKTFADKFMEVLTHEQYQNWRKTNFRYVSDIMIEELVSFISNPEKDTTI